MGAGQGFRFRWSETIRRLSGHVQEKGDGDPGNCILDGLPLNPIEKKVVFQGVFQFPVGDAGDCGLRVHIQIMTFL